MDDMESGIVIVSIEESRNEDVRGGFRREFRLNLGKRCRFYCLEQEPGRASILVFCILLHPIILYLKLLLVVLEVGFDFRYLETD